MLTTARHKRIAHARCSPFPGPEWSSTIAPNRLQTYFRCEYCDARDPVGKRVPVCRCCSLPIADLKRTGWGLDVHSGLTCLVWTPMETHSIWRPVSVRIDPECVLRGEFV